VTLALTSPTISLRQLSDLVDSLLAQRHLIDDAHHCPHGRPTALVLTENELERQFGRLG